MPSRRRAGDEVGQDSKTLGDCQICGNYMRLTVQHVRFVSELKGYRLMICGTCHGVVTRYEEEVGKLRQHVKGQPRNEPKPRYLPRAPNLITVAFEAAGTRSMNTGVANANVLTAYVRPSSARGMRVRTQSLLKLRSVRWSGLQQ